MTMEGGCFCGAVRYRIDGRPRQITHCHCSHCRRTSGAPFLTWVEFEAAGFEIVTGSPGRFESRPLVTRQFCGQCGTQLTHQHTDATETISVTAGSLDHPEVVEPQNHVWCDRMLPWIELADELPRYGLERGET